MPTKSGSLPVKALSDAHLKSDILEQHVGMDMFAGVVFMPDTWTLSRHKFPYFRTEDMEMSIYNYTHTHTEVVMVGIFLTELAGFQSWQMWRESHHPNHNC